MSNNRNKILIVDDEICNYKLIKEILTGFNIDLLYASNGLEAIEKCKKNPDIALILMDIRMKGMNGFEAAVQINCFRSNLPIVFQTAYAKDFLKDEFMISLSSGYLEKPIRRNELITEIKKHMVLRFSEPQSMEYTPKKNFSLQHIFRFLF